jgi:hypothetical protein
MHCDGCKLTNSNNVCSHRSSSKACVTHKSWIEFVANSTTHVYKGVKIGNKQLKKVFELKTSDYLSLQLSIITLLSVQFSFCGLSKYNTRTLELWFCVGKLRFGLSSQHPTVLLWGSTLLSNVMLTLLSRTYDECTYLGTCRCWHLLDKGCKWEIWVYVPMSLWYRRLFWIPFGCL